MLFQSLWWIIFDDGCNIPFPKQRDRLKGEETAEYFRGGPHKSLYIVHMNLTLTWPLSAFVVQNCYLLYRHMMENRS